MLYGAQLLLYEKNVCYYLSSIKHEMKKNTKYFYSASFDDECSKNAENSKKICQLNQ